MIDDDATLIEPVRVPTTITQGTLLLNTYVVERDLGAGGMALTYLTHHKELSNTKHVIKVLKTGLSKDLADAFNLTSAEANDKSIELLKREAEALLSIHHDAIVGYQGFQRDNQHGHCLIMEYVQGPSLKELLKQRHLSVEEMLQLRERLAQGLAAAHAKGIFHRDISPDNIILPNGKVSEAKLIDFGIARRSDPNAGTVFGSVFVGKYSYAAPEQLSLYDGIIGPYSDIYSLALVLAEALIGKRLDMGNSEESARKARRTVPDLNQIPANLRPQFVNMLLPNPKDRAQSLTALLQTWSASDNKTRKPYKTLLMGVMATASLAAIAIVTLKLTDPLGLQPNPINQALSKGHGYLNLHSKPEGALVLANDTHSFIGITPINKAYIQAGTNKLLVKMKGYSDIEQQIDIKAESEQVLNIDLTTNKPDEL